MADEESDKHVRISWEDALEATLVGATGFPMTVPATGADVMVAPVGVGSDMKLSEWKAAADDIATYNKGGNKDWKDLKKDIRIVVARPFIEHMMHSAILAVSGRETGATLFGPSDMQLSANTQVKTIEGHYTGCAAAPPPRRPAAPLLTARRRAFRIGTLRPS